MKIMTGRREERRVKFPIYLFFIPLIFFSFFACKGTSEGPATTDQKKAEYVLKVAHNGTENHPFQAGFERFKEVLREKTQGAVEVQIFPNEQLSSEEEASQMVKLGLIAASASSTAGGLSTTVPEAAGSNGRTNVAGS